MNAGNVQYSIGVAQKDSGTYDSLLRTEKIF